MRVLNGASSILVRLVDGVEVLEGLRDVGNILDRGRVAYRTSSLAESDVPAFAYVLNDYTPGVEAIEVLGCVEGLLCRSFKARVEEPTSLSRSRSSIIHP